ncbi:unnamed protein product [Umbelopsis vinacea]
MLDPSDIPVGSDSDTEIKKPVEHSVALDNENYQLPIERNFVGRLRHQLREPLAEFLATCVMIVLGDGVVAQIVLSSGVKGQYLSISFGWAFAVMCAIYIGGGISGAHLNPAVTLCMAIWRGFPWRKVPAYWLAQFLGALTGAAIVFANYRKAFTAYSGEGVYPVTGTNATAGVFSTYPAAFMTPEGSFFSELLGTCVLLLVILGQSDDHNMHAEKNSPLVVAFTVLSIGISLGWETGYAINPARDFGPRCFAAMAGWGTEVFTTSGSYTWVPIIGPFVGAALAGLIYELFIDSHSNRTRLTHRKI